MRERIAQLVQGTQIIDLNSVGGISVHSVLADAGGTFEVMPQQFDVTGQGESNELFTENWTLAIRNRRQDDVARQIHVLSLMLRDAWRYTFTSRQIEPVYLVVRAAGETNERYALVHSCPKLSGSNPLFGTAFEDHLSSGLFDVGIPILRYCWQDGPPGVLPSLTCLTELDDWTNLVLNPGFETAGAGDPDFFASWVETASDGAIADETVDIHAGGHAAKLTAGATVSQSGCRLVTFFSVTAGVTYQLTIWSHGDGTYDGRYRIRDKTSGADIVAMGSLGVTGATYAQTSIPFTAPVGCAEIYVYLYCPPVNGGIAYFDDVSVHSPTACSAPIYVTNHRDTAVLTHIYNQDVSGAGAWSANLVAAVSIPIWSVAGALPALNDCIYFGNHEATDRTFHHVAIPIAVAGVYNAAIYLEYWNGAWATLSNNAGAINEKATVLPACVVNGVATIFKVATTWVINVGDLTDWIPYNIAGEGGAGNPGITGYWIRARIAVYTNMPTIPVTSAEAIYVPKTPEVRIPATAFPNGDTFPVVRMLMHHPFGGDSDEGFANTSRIIVGLKSDVPTNFVSHLNFIDAGNPLGWTHSLWTDATQVADPACPMGQATNISFATTTDVLRVRLTGTAMLNDYWGTYRVFLRCWQVGGVAGEVSVALNVRLIGIGGANPKMRMATKALATFDSGLEVVDCGVLSLPFTQMAQADLSLLGMDLLFEVYASRSAAAATLRIADVILIPIDEWSAQYDDPLSDIQYGTSALRGRSVLDVDGGIIRPRVIKQYSNLGVTTPTQMMPMETWRNGGPWPKIPPGKAARLYFLMYHFRPGGTWGTGPLIATLGQMLAFQLYGRERYLVLRGDR